MPKAVHFPSDRTYVKICGVTTVEAARLAIAAGADAIGVNFHPPSPRCVSRSRARDIAAVASSVDVFGVFVELGLGEIREIVNETGITAVQLHGTPLPQAVGLLADLPVMQAFRYRDTDSLKEIENYWEQCRFVGHLPAAILIDAFDEKRHGGTGKTVDWHRLVGAMPTDRPWVLAGGLTPDNVAGAIAACHPNGVDVASGVESSPGVKDAAKIASFLRAVRKGEEASVFHPLPPTPLPPLAQ